MVRRKDQPGYKGAVYALQKQSQLSIHPGGRTALALLGKAQYLELNASQICLFGGEKESLPAWFRNHPWPQKIKYKGTSFLPPEKGLTDLPLSDFSIKVSGAARAIMECLYLAPKKFDLMECLELMENLNNIRPQQVQALLEACTYVKVKWLFLYMAEKLDYSWFRYISLQT